jgi:hypothetical protein
MVGPVAGRECRVMPYAIEQPLNMEPVTRDPFLDGLGDEPRRGPLESADWRALDPHARQRTLVRASLLMSERTDAPTHRRWD